MFLYGLRTITPIALGISHVPAWRFVLFNILGAGAWAVAFGGGGYLFGNALEGLLGDLRHYERMLFALVAVAGGMAWILSVYRRIRKTKDGPIPPG